MKLTYNTALEKIHFSLVLENAKYPITVENENRFMKEYEKFIDVHGLCCVVYDTDKKLILTGHHVNLSWENNTVFFKYFDKVIISKEKCSEDSPMEIKLEKIGNSVVI